MWGIKLERQSMISLGRQIFETIRQRILSGEITQGETLPSTRELARGLGVSRNTVCEAYDMLLTEGYITSRQGASTRVTAGLLLDNASDTGKKSSCKSQLELPVTDFKTGQPDLSCFPWFIWKQLLTKAFDNLPVTEWGYSGPEGFAPLRLEIAQWLLRSRSIQVDPEHIFITAGATQALHLLVDLLSKDGRQFALENPCHPGIHGVITNRSHGVRWMPVDAWGADVSALDGKNITAAYVTPSHQFPLGGILPANRRAMLIRMAREHDFYIIEDDYDSEFRYCGAPITPLYVMDPSRVIYVGTFSKTVFPALRIGFVILPEPLQTEWKKRRMILDFQNSVLEQAALAEFLQTRKLDKHFQRMRRIYGEKRKILLQAIRQTFGDEAIPWGDESGLHLALQFPGSSLGEKFTRECLDAGIRAYPLAYYCPGENIHRDKLLLGYGHLSPEQIREGIEKLHQFMLSFQG